MMSIIKFLSVATSYIVLCKFSNQELLEQRDKDQYIKKQFKNNEQELNEEYKEKVEVVGLPITQNVYSGYIQVNESGAKLYYQLFSPTEIKTDMNTPLILWLNGGPGVTSQNGNFKGIGPLELVSINGKITVKPRVIHWADEYHLLFIDQPVGTGYSVGFKESQYNVSTTEQAAQDLYTFFQRFFEIYSDLKPNPFYLTGQSYAGHYIPTLAEIILKEKNLNKKMNLQGIAIGDGLVDFKVQVEPYAHYAYSIGISTKKNYEEDLICANIINLNIKTNYTHYIPIPKKCQNLRNFICERAGNVDKDNFRKYGSDGSQYMIYQYLNDISTKKQFGVPEHVQFLTGSKQVFQQFEESRDIVKSFTEKFQFLIPRIPILLYGGQDDINVNLIGCWKWILNLPNSYFPNNQHIKYQTKQIWKINGKVAGNVKIQGKFYFVIVNKAGHSVPVDQPESARDMIKKFIQGKIDWTN